MFARFTPEALGLLFTAQTEAMQRSQPYVSSEHLLLAMASDQTLSLCEAFNDQNLDLDQLRDLLSSLLGTGTKHNSDALPMTPSLQVIVHLAEQMPKDNSKIADLHLLLAILVDEENAACGALEELDFNLN